MTVRTPASEKDLRRAGQCAEQFCRGNADDGAMTG